MLPGGEQEVTLRNYLELIVKNRWLIGAFSIVGTMAVVIWVFSVTPIYRATTTILIEQAPIRVLSRIEEVYQPMTWTGYYETQYKILKSRALAKRVFDALDLYTDPDYQQAMDPIGAFLRWVTVMPIQKSRLVELSFAHRHPQKAAVLANALGKAYIDQDVEMKLSATKYAVEWLTKQLEEQRKKLEESETQLQNFVEEHKIVTVPGLEEESNKLIEALKEQQANLERGYAELSKRYKPKHPKMARLISEVKAVKQRLEEEVQKTIELNRLTVDYNVLKREVQSGREMYEALLRRTKEASLTGELEVTNLRIVDQAEVPTSPIRPKKRRDITIGIVMSTALGLGVAFLKEYLDNTIKSSDEVEQYLMTPFLGYIPSGKARTTDEQDRIVQQDPASVSAESYRTIRTGVLFSAIDKPIKSLLVTSPLPQDGKTMFSMNFAIVMTQANEQVLLVEADLRRPRLAEAFRLKGAPGLSSYLVEHRRFEEIFHDTDILNLKFVPAGTIPPNPAELLGSTRMKDFLHEAMTRFDRVIIDSPPVLSVTDAELIAHEVDGVLCVVRCGKTQVDAARHTKKKLTDAKAKLLGIVINDVEPSHRAYYYYYHYRYERGKKEKASTVQHPASPT